MMCAVAGGRVHDLQRKKSGNGLPVNSAETDGCICLKLHRNLENDVNPKGLLVKHCKLAVSAAPGLRQDMMSWGDTLDVK